MGRVCESHILSHRGDLGNNVAVVREEKKRAVMNFGVIMIEKWRMEVGIAWATATREQETFYGTSSAPPQM